MYVNYKYKQRSYAHFDKPISIKKAQQLVLNRRAVARHAFWPLVVQPITTLKRKATPNSKNTGTQRVFSKKKRPIAYAAHSDSHIYSYYSYMLSEKLETIYGQSQHLHYSVLAYRKFVPGKSNIDCALNAFREIEQYEECEVLALDVKGFFDNLDHALLKDAWAQLLGASCLPSDHFAVFK